MQRMFMNIFKTIKKNNVDRNILNDKSKNYYNENKMYIRIVYACT